jgi:hypothetical protein
MKWRVWRRPGGRSILVSIIFLGVMLTLATTPIVWILSGRPNESYPELLFLFIGVPFAGLMVVVAVCRFILKNRTRHVTS